MSQLFRRGDLSRGGWESVVDGALPGWTHTGLRVAELGDTGLELPAGDIERVVVPLTGDVTLRVADVDGRGSDTLELAGRSSVFDGPVDVAYLGVATAATVHGPARVAIAEAPATRPIPVQVLRAGEVGVELRGAGVATRQVHNFGTPGALEAEKLIVCEVITPAGNWSSYPAHKHDEALPGHESRLEEIYYFEVGIARGVDPPASAFDPFGMFASDAVSAQVRSGDIALIPSGYHGPAAAAPGYDLYYLNVMAGPDPDRAWLITDHPTQAWQRAEWQHQSPDPRLPYTRDLR